MDFLTAILSPIPVNNIISKSRTFFNIHPETLYVAPINLSAETLTFMKCSAWPANHILCNIHCTLLQAKTSRADLSFPPLT